MLSNPFYWTGLTIAFAVLLKLISVAQDRRWASSAIPRHRHAIDRVDLSESGAPIERCACGARREGYFENWRDPSPLTYWS